MRAGVAQAIHHAAHRSAFGTRPGRAAPDAERARRPGARVRGGDDLRDAPGARLRRGDRRRRARRRASSASPTRCSSTGSASARPSHAAEASSASAATATSRSPACRASTARARSTRSGRARGNVQCLDVLRAMGKSPASLEAFFAEVDEAAVADPRLDAFAAALREELPPTSTTIETRARRWSSAWPSPSRPPSWSAMATSRRRRLLRLPPRRRLGPRLRHPPGGHGLHPHHRSPPRGRLRAGRGCRASCGCGSPSAS